MSRIENLFNILEDVTSTYAMVIAEMVIGNSEGPKGYERFKPLPYSDSKQRHVIVYAKIFNDDEAGAIQEYHKAGKDLDVIIQKSKSNGKVESAAGVLWNVSTDSLVKVPGNDEKIFSLGMCSNKLLKNWGILVSSTLVLGQVSGGIPKGNQQVGPPPVSSVPFIDKVVPAEPPKLATSTPTRAAGSGVVNQDLHIHSMILVKWRKLFKEQGNRTGMQITKSPNRDEILKDLEKLKNFYGFVDSRNDGVNIFVPIEKISPTQFIGSVVEFRRFNDSIFINDNSKADANAYNSNINVLQLIK